MATIRRLTVLYDPSCGLCQRAAAWLEVQPTYFKLEMLAAGFHVARTRYPMFPRVPDQMIAITDSGNIYRGVSAWLMCLYALKRYRVWAFRLNSPALRPLARQAIQLLSTHRHGVSKLLGLRARDIEALEGSCGAACVTGAKTGATKRD